jgi:hypothetical protein
MRTVRSTPPIKIARRIARRRKTRSLAAVAFLLGLALELACTAPLILAEPRDTEAPEPTASNAPGAPTSPIATAFPDVTPPPEDAADDSERSQISSDPDATSIHTFDAD